MSACGKKLQKNEIKKIKQKTPNVGELFVFCK